MTFDHFLNWDRETALSIAPKLIAINPNLITTASLALAIIGLSLLFMDGGWLFGVLGALLIFGSRWVDWMDGYVARASGRCSNIGGLYDIAVGFVTLVFVMVAIGYRQGDTTLIWVGAVSAILLRLVLMSIGWLLSQRQGLEVIPWNPQKMLIARQASWMRTIKWALDVCRSDYWIFVLAVFGGSGLHLWAWSYSVVAIILTGWLIVAAVIYTRCVHPGMAKSKNGQETVRSQPC